MKVLLTLFLFLFQLVTLAQGNFEKPFEPSIHSHEIEQAVLVHAKKISIFCRDFKHAEECSVPNGSEIEKYESGDQLGKLRVFHNAILRSADDFAQYVISGEFIELKERDLGKYYEAMEVLDKLSRSQDPKVVNAVAHLAKRLHLEWMEYFGDIFNRWIIYERNISVSTGPLVGYLAGAYVINSAELSALQTSSLFRYVRFKMPIKLFSYSLPFAATKLGFDSLKGSRPLILSKIPPSPAHLIRFLFNHRPLLDEFIDPEVNNELLIFETKNKIIKDSIIAASVLTTSSSSGNLVLTAVAKGKRAMSLLKVLRVTPMSFAIGVSLEVGLSWGLNKYQDWELVDQIEDSLKVLLEDPYLDGEVRNKKRTDVAFKVSQLEVFRLAGYHSKVMFLKNIIELVAEMQSDSDLLSSLMLEILKLSKPDLVDSGFLQMKYDYCSDANMAVVIRSKKSIQFTINKLDSLLNDMIKEAGGVKKVISNISERWSHQFEVNDLPVARLLRERPLQLGRDIEELEKLRDLLNRIAESGVLELHFKNNLVPMIYSKELLLAASCEGYIKPLVTLDR